MQLTQIPTKLISQRNNRHCELRNYTIKVFTPAAAINLWKLNFPTNKNASVSAWLISAIAKPAKHEGLLGRSPAGNDKLSEFALVSATAVTATTTTDNYPNLGGTVFSTDRYHALKDLKEPREKAAPLHRRSCVYSRLFGRFGIGSRFLRCLRVPLNADVLKVFRFDGLSWRFCGKTGAGSLCGWSDLSAKGLNNYVGVFV